MHGERADEQNEENDKRQAALQSTKSKRIPVILSTHEAKNDEVVIRVVCLPRRSLGRRRVEAVACHAIANCEGGSQPQTWGAHAPRVLATAPSPSRTFAFCAIRSTWRSS